MADSATPHVACSPTGLSRKTNSTNGDANKVAVLRATIYGSPSLWNIPLRCPSRRNRDTNHDVAWLSHYFLSQTVCCIRSSFRIFRNQDEQFVSCRFIIFVVIVIFCAIKLQITVINRKVGPRPLDKAPVSRVFQRFHVLSCTHHTNFDAGHVRGATWCSTSSSVGPRPITTTFGR